MYVCAYLLKKHHSPDIFEPVVYRTICGRSEIKKADFVSKPHLCVCMYVCM